MAITLEQYTCDLFGCSVEELFTPRRYREIVNARQVCIWVMNKYGNGSPSDIGQYFNHDRTTVYAAIRAVNDFVETDKEFRVKLDKIKLMHRNLDIPFRLNWGIYDTCKIEDDEIIII